MPIHAPKILVFGGSEPLNVIGHHRDPQKAPPWPEPHLHANFGADRSPEVTTEGGIEMRLLLLLLLLLLL